MKIVVLSLLCTLITAARLWVFLVQDNVTAFQTSFFSFLSLIFAIYSGNTMAFLYDVSPSLIITIAWTFHSGMLDLQLEYPCTTLLLMLRH